MNVCVYVSFFVCTTVHMYFHVRTCTCIHMYMYTHVHVYMLKLKPRCGMIQFNSSKLILIGILNQKSDSIPITAGSIVNSTCNSTPFH